MPSAEGPLADEDDDLLRPFQASSPLRWILVADDDGSMHTDLATIFTTATLESEDLQIESEPELDIPEKDLSERSGGDQTDTGECFRMLTILGTLMNRLNRMRSRNDCAYRTDAKEAETSTQVPHV